MNIGTPPRHSADRAARCSASLLIALSLSLLPPLAQAQTASTPATPATETKEDVVTLSPFEVTSTSDVGYEAKDTLAGGRLNQQLKDVASQVTIMTSEFLSDLAITDLNDALQYSLNVEGASSFVDVGAVNSAQNNAETLQPFAGSPRTRGINVTNIGRDFFDSRMPSDSYNLERITFSSGANNTLFGSANPAGTIDVTTKRALVHRRKFSVSYRVDSEGSERATVDLNIPVIPNRLAIRYAGLRERTNSFREPSYRDQDRSFVAVTFNPWQRVSLRGWYEDYQERAQPVRNALFFDAITPWIQAGRPIFDNGGTGAFPAVTTTAATPFQRLNPTQPYYFFDASGGMASRGMPVQQIANMVQTVGYDNAAIVAAPNNFARSLTDPSVISFDTAFAGNANQNRQAGRNYGVVLNINPLENLYAEIGAAHDIFKHQSTDWFNLANSTLRVDANKYLNDRVTPNPNVGRYYIDDVLAAGSQALGLRDQVRASVAYKLDFTRHDGWVKWLGRHNIGAIYDWKRVSDVGQQRTDVRLVSNHSFTPAITNFTTYNAAQRQIRFRYYLPDANHPGATAVSLPFDPLSPGGVIELPDSGGAVISQWDSPYGSTTAPSIGRTVVESKLLATQSALWKDRLILNLGWREDKARPYGLTGFTFARPDALAASNTGNSYILSVFDSMTSDNWVERDGKTLSKTSKGLVYHAFDWLSLHATKQATADVTGLTRHNLDGTINNLNNGSSEDYGFTLRLLQNRLSIRVNKYSVTQLGTNSTGLVSNPLPTNAVGGNSIRDDIGNLEASVLLANTVTNGQIADAARSEKYAAFDSELVDSGRISLGGNYGGLRDDYDFIADRVAKGYEVTIVGNPTPQWRVSITMAKNQSRTTNLSPQYFDFINERIQIWGDYANRTYVDATTGQTLAFRTAMNTTPQVAMKDLLKLAINNFNYVRLADGAPNTLERKYRVVATSRYSFKQGWLKGSFVGATYLWQSPAAIGYRTISISDNPWVVPGISTATLDVPDINNPIKGGPIESCDVMAGYSRKLFHNKILWDIQLNVRNALGRDGLLAQRASPNEVVSNYSLQVPRTYILTNTFSF